MTDRVELNGIGLIGGGRMGRALIQGILRSGVVSENAVTVREPDGNSQSWWRKHLPGCAIANDAVAAIASADLVVIAVKPDMVAKVAVELADHLESRTVLSVAAGINLATLQKIFRTDRVVRVMPNTPALVGEGASAYCCGAGVTSEASNLIAKILTSVGIAVAIPEKQMDAVTGLSGSGPAMACLMIEALADGGVLAGLPRALAIQLAAQTLLGTAKMVLQEGTHPAELKDQVASPGGTTIAALQVLEQAGVRGALMSAVKKAAERSAELGG